MISSLDGNDVFAISRMYEQKYRDELKDYVEVTPPLLLNIAGVTVETGSSSFKEFMILFDKIYQGRNAIVSKKKMDPYAKKSDKVRELAIKRFYESFNIGVSVDAMTIHTLPGIRKNVDEGLLQIKLEEDYRTRVGMYDLIDKRLEDWILKAENHVEKPKPERLEKIKDIKGFHQDIKDNKDTITQFDKKDSPQTKTGIYDEFMRINVNINDANVKIGMHFVPWSKIIRSNEVNYNVEDTEIKINSIIEDLHDNMDPENEITITVYDNMVKLGEQMKKLPASSTETGQNTGYTNEIIIDPSAIRYNKANYKPPVPPLTPNSSSSNGSDSESESDSGSDSDSEGDSGSDSGGDY